MSLSFNFGYKTSPEEETWHFPLLWFARAPYAFSVCVLGLNLVFNHENIKRIWKWIDKESGRH